MEQRVGEKEIVEVLDSPEHFGAFEIGFVHQTGHLMIVVTRLFEARDNLGVENVEHMTHLGNLVQTAFGEGALDNSPGSAHQKGGAQNGE